MENYSLAYVYCLCVYVILISFLCSPFTDHICISKVVITEWCTFLGRHCGTYLLASVTSYVYLRIFKILTILSFFFCKFYFSVNFLICILDGLYCYHFSTVLTFSQWVLGEDILTCKIPETKAHLTAVTQMCCWADKPMLRYCGKDAESTDTNNQNQ